MSAPFRNAVLTFAATWLFVLALDAIALLHWPNPLLWDAGNRAFAFIAASWLAAGSFAITKVGQSK